MINADLNSDWAGSLPKDRLLAEFSLWSADAGHLARDIARAEDFVDIWHVDVCDGHFAPQILLFSDHVSLLARASQRPIHVHLMVDAALLPSQIDQFAEAGAHLISLHIENTPEVISAALDRIDALGCRAGLVVTLDTTPQSISPWLDRLAMVTMVGTQIGIKGIGPDAATYTRLAEARRLIDAHKGNRPLLAADGGIREHTVPLLRQAGADTVVMGSLAFGAADLSDRMRWLHGL